jgi:hypothetical protein
MKKNIISTLMFLLLSTTAYSMNWKQSNSLDNVRIDKAGSIYGNTSTAISDGECNTTNFVVPANQPGFDAMLSLLLSALVSGKNVQLSVADCNSGGNLVIIDGVRINK